MHHEIKQFLAVLARVSASAAIASGVIFGAVGIAQSHLPNVCPTCLEAMPVAAVVSLQKVAFLPASR